MWLEIGLAILIPGCGAAAFVIKYFWKKEKCFIAMENKINELSKHDGDSSETHTDFDFRLNEIEKRQQKNEIYLKLLMDNAGIIYKK